MSTNINLGTKNISFMGGKTYHFVGSGASVTMIAQGYITAAEVSPAWMQANASSFTKISGIVFWNGGSPITSVSLVSDNIGFVAKVEEGMGMLAMRDSELAIKIKSVETVANGKAAIDDSSVAADKVLSASKVTDLIAAAKSELQTFASNAANLIDDTSTGTDKVLSASKITSLLTALDAAAANYAAAVKTDLLGGADSAYDTLKEIQTFLQANAGVLTALENAGMNKVSFTELQTLSPEQKQTARTNIGAITADEATTIANDRIAALIGDINAFSPYVLMNTLPLSV